MFNTRWKSTTKCIECKRTAGLPFPPLFAEPQSSFNALHCLWSLSVIRSNSSCTSNQQHIVLPLFAGGIVVAVSGTDLWKLYRKRPAPMHGQSKHPPTLRELAAHFNLVQRSGTSFPWMVPDSSLCEVWQKADTRSASNASWTKLTDTSWLGQMLWARDTAAIANQLNITSD